MTVLLLALLLGVEPAVDFETEIIPVLTKAGCNAGACHGAAAGRGGFRLSLFGRDAESDYSEIVHAFEGRRINLAKPAESLLLKKPTGYLDHGGEMCLPEESRGAIAILQWISAGAVRGKFTKELVDFKVTAARHYVEEVPAEVKLQAFARWDAEPPADVTQRTIFLPTDSGAVEVREAADGTITAQIKRRGPQQIVVRFLDQVVPLTITSPLGDQPVDLQKEPRANFIDEEIYRQLSVLRLRPSPPVDDATFLRRVRLDLTGRLPAMEEVESYLRDTSADKRARLVERLLTSSEFVEIWTLRFAQQLRLHSVANEDAAAKAYANWIAEMLAQGRPYNVWAKELLTAQGDSHVVGPANFGRMVNDARGQAELVGDFFLGARLGCANCHDHPLDRWTQDDYHGLAAVFARLSRTRHVQQTARGDVTNLRTGEPAIPRIPGVKDLQREMDPIEETAAWLTSESNPWFARAAVNRLWQAMFGRGLVEAIDDLRASNPATHPELLDLLARDFIAHRYDLRHTLRQIALSHAYARSGQTLDGNGSDDRFYARSYRRPLLPEVLADALADVTGVENNLGHAAAKRAVQMVDPLIKAPALDALGRCSRASGCADRASGGLAIQLHLLNGELINGKLTNPASRLQKMLAAGATNEQVVQQFFLRGLNRPPTNAEAEHWGKLLATSDPKDRAQRCEDFVWSLLCSRDFVENH